MDKTQLIQFISEQKTAFIASVNEQGYPVVRAMLAPRKIDGNEIYFTTNTSSNKIKQYLANDKACIYFYKQGVTAPDYCVLKFKGKTAEYYCDFKTVTVEL